MSFYEFRGFEIPDYMESGLRYYLEYGLEPGDFLTSIICNDLTRAVQHADDTNIKNIPAYVGYFYNHTPSICWGSKEKMKKWMETKQEERRVENGL